VPRQKASAFNLSAYMAEKAAAPARIVRRYARGNVALQRGDYIDAAELTRRSEAAVVSMRNIEKMTSSK